MFVKQNVYYTSLDGSNMLERFYYNQNYKQNEIRDVK